MTKHLSLNGLQNFSARSGHHLRGMPPRPSRHRNPLGAPRMGRATGRPCWLSTCWTANPVWAPILPGLTERDNRIGSTPNTATLATGERTENVS
jgi:hypothetical protein